ncbi:uncharacterized protein PAC_13923 [Phialocephala subalpina]|uniref:Uncharacterized protein n=1 Tax=Phialocephala subalpina TaxID=576137 RepID=A0A1L7XGE2_9HELO|nr:uncharacterized protein PAC_13923 [Phialocephala subalpina]
MGSFPSPNRNARPYISHTGKVSHVPQHTTAKSLEFFCPLHHHPISASAGIRVSAVKHLTFFFTTIHLSRTSVVITTSAVKNLRLLTVNIANASNTTSSDGINMDNIDVEDIIPARRITRQTYKSRHLRPIPRPDNKYRITKLLPRNSRTKNLDSRATELQCITEKPKKKEALLLTLLNRDCLFLLFDTIMNQGHTIKMTPGLQPNGLLKSLSQVSHKLRDEIKNWTYTQPNLVGTQTFGLYNPLVTSFDFAFFAVEALERNQGYGKSKVRRVYHPEAAVKHVYHLEIWQRAMNRADEPFQAISIGAWAWVDSRYRGEDWSCNKELVELGQHEQDGVRDVLILDRKKYQSKEEVEKNRDSWRPRLGWEEGEQAFAWTEDWDGFFDHRRVVERED